MYDGFPGWIVLEYKCYLAYNGLHVCILHTTHVLESVMMMVIIVTCMHICGKKVKDVSTSTAAANIVCCLFRVQHMCYKQLSTNDLCKWHSLDLQREAWRVRSRTHGLLHIS